MPIPMKTRPLFETEKWRVRMKINGTASNTKHKARRQTSRFRQDGGGTHTRVHDTIRKRDVYRRKQQNWFDHQHLEWAEDGALEDGVKSPADAFALRVDVLILHRICRAQALRLLREEHGGVGLGDKAREQCARGRKEHHDQEDPAPAEIVARAIGEECQRLTTRTKKKKVAHMLPTAGPVAGPRKQDAMNTLVAMLRFMGSHISAMTPMLLVSGATPKKPQRNRVTSRVVMLFART